MAVICGKVFHNKEHEGKWLNGIDCDNKLGLEKMCPSGIEKIASITLVEQHANKDKCHIYFYTKEPIKSKVGNDGKENTVPQIEIKSEGKFILYCAGSIHKDNSVIEIIGIDKVKTLDKEALEINIDSICKEYNIPYLNGLVQSQIPISELTKKGFEIHEGGDRSIHILRYLDSKKKKNPEFDIEYLFDIGMMYNNEHCKPPYLEEKIRALAKQANEYGTKKLLESEVKDVIENPITLSKTKNVIGRGVKQIKDSHTFVTLRQSEEILLHDGKVYSKTHAESIIKEETETLIENCTTHDRNEVINKIKAQTFTDIEEFDTDPNIITTENGILDIETQELKNHTPSYLSRVLLPVNFVKPTNEINDKTVFEDIEKNLKDTLFWKFLKSSFTVDGKFMKKDFETVLEIIASFFVKHTIDEKAFMFLGKGENGKSVLLDYIENLLGEKNISHIPLQEITEDRFMRAELDGKSANIFADLESNELKRTGILKIITSNEPIEAQRKHSHPFLMKVIAKLLFSCNRFPKVYDQSQGFFRRWIIVKWLRNFEGDPERDEHLKEKLRTNTEEKTLVFSNLIQISRILLRKGIFTHSKKWGEIQKEWNANADPLDDFDTNYILESDNHKTVRETYQFYKEIIYLKNEIPLQIGRFGKEFAQYRDQDREQINGRTQRCWLNIDFKKPIQTDMKEFENE